MNYDFFFQISKLDKSAGWNKGVQVGKFLKSNKVCCTIIQETKVIVWKNKNNQKVNALDFFETCFMKF